MRITELDQPFGGQDITVGVDASWTLIDQANGKVVFEEAVSTSSTVKAQVAFAATDRARIATEQAVRANLREGIRRIGALKLAP